MFERFTQPARRAVVDAQEEARDLRHGYVGTDHLLLALFREPSSVARRALDRLGVERDAVRSDVVRVGVRDHRSGSESKMRREPRSVEADEMEEHLRGLGLLE